MKTFIIDSFSYETLQEFIQFSNDYWDFQWSIILDSDTGLSLVSENIRKLLIDHGKEYVTEVLCNRAYGVGFMFLRSLVEEVPVILTPGCMANVQLSEGPVTLNSKGKLAYGHDYAVLESLKVLRGREKFEAEKFLTASEKKRFLSGEKVWLNYTRMREIFNDNSKV